MFAQTLFIGYIHGKPPPVKKSKQEEGLRLLSATNHAPADYH